jgi:DNA-binding MarR family transcriptional regulator
MFALTAVIRAQLIEAIREELREFIARVVLRNQAVADHLGLHPVDLQCLNLIALAEAPLTPGQIAERAGLPSSSATRVLDRLEAAGYIQRARDTSDRRKVFIHPDPARLEHIATLYKSQQTGMATMANSLTERDLRAVLRFLREGNQPSSPGEPPSSA